MGRPNEAHQFEHGTTRCMTTPTLLENTNPGGYGVIISAAVDPLRVGGLGQQYGERLIVKGNGNVGIGTTAPQATLHVGGSVKIDGVNVLEFGSGVASKEPNAGRIGYQTFTANALDVVGAGTNGTNRRIKFWAEGGATIEGTLGIGTAAPAGKLEVIGTAVISNGNTYATKNNRMAAGSLSVPRRRNVFAARLSMPASARSR